MWDSSPISCNWIPTFMLHSISSASANEPHSLKESHPTRKRKSLSLHHLVHWWISAETMLLLIVMILRHWFSTLQLAQQQHTYYISCNWIPTFKLHGISSASANEPHSLEESHPTRKRKSVSLHYLVHWWISAHERDNIVANSNDP